MIASAPALALTAALCFAFARIFLKRGLQSSTPLTAVVIGVVFTAAFLWLMAALTAPLSLLLSWGVLPFVAAGLFSPGLARLFVYVGVDRIGASRASALSSTAPLFAIVLAVLLLGERPSGWLLVGALGVVAGGVLLSQQGRLDQAWRRRDMAFPLAGALGFALRDTISRWGLGSFPHPAIAAVVATMTSVVVLGIFGLRRRGDFRSDRTGLVFMALAGLCEALASLALWGALAAGNVSVVSPLVNSQPVLTVILAAFFLRDLERVTWRIVVATLAIVAGAVVVIRAGLG
jgi:drug/metabolite transporter (DMT)-like permease